MAETLIAPQSKNKAAEPRRASLEAYFRAEEKALHKHEYHDGIVIQMAGGTFNHDNLSGRAITCFNNFVENNELNYFVNGSDTKIWIETYNKVVYPDVLIVCEAPKYFANREDTIVNPLVIDDGTWLLRDYYGEEAVAILYALHNCPLPLNRLYRGLKLKN